MDQERYESNEIMDARERVTEDVREVAYNANVVERAQHAMGEAGMRVRHMTVENPMAMLLAGMAVGFLIGMLLPVSRFEFERIGPIAEDMKDRARAAGGEMIRRGTEVIKESIKASGDGSTSMRPEQTSGMT
ncbi:MAG TPA: hypothetical protein VGR69_04085 [Candidatus Rubrimentiphilum sp.]|nr:hypothetical protein [Candidatus Rubrimentiphilum sp.]